MPLPDEDLLRKCRLLLARNTLCFCNLEVARWLLEAVGARGRNTVS